MNKVEQFKDFLKSIRFSFKECNPYHIQINTVHNFYPTKNKYYNSSTNASVFYEDFSSREQFENFLIKHQPSEYFELVDEFKDEKSLDHKILEQEKRQQIIDWKTTFIEILFVIVIVLNVILLIREFLG